jgi:hypothetical protein
MARTAAASPNSLPQSSMGRFDVTSVRVRGSGASRFPADLRPRSVAVYSHLSIHTERDAFRRRRVSSQRALLVGNTVGIFLCMPGCQRSICFIVAEAHHK